MFNNKYISWAIVAVLVVLLIWLLKVDSGEPRVIEKRTTDTLFVEKIDTVYITKVVTKVEKEPSDTVYLTVRDSILVPIPRQEYTFSEPDMFDFRVKGYSVEFLDAKVYPKTVYKTVTNTIEKEIARYRTSLFVNAGFSSICGTFTPEVGVSLSLKGRWLISANLGLYNKKVVYGATIGYNVLKK